MTSGTYYVVDRDDLWDLLCGGQGRSLGPTMWWTGMISGTYYVVDRDVSAAYYVVDRDDLWDLLCGGQG